MRHSRTLTPWGPAAQARHRARVLRIEPAKLPAVSPLRALVAWPFRCARAAKTTRRRLRSAVPAATPGGRPSGKPQGLPSLRLSVVSARGALAGPSGLLRSAGKRTVALRESLCLVSGKARAESWRAAVVIAPQAARWLLKFCRPFGSPTSKLSARQANDASRALSSTRSPRKTFLKSPLAFPPPSHPDHFNPRFASGERRGRGEAETQPPAGRPKACTSRGPLERDAGSHASRFPEPSGNF